MKLRYLLRLACFSQCHTICISWIGERIIPLLISILSSRCARIEKIIIAWDLIYIILPFAHTRLQLTLISLLNSRVLRFIFHIYISQESRSSNNVKLRKAQRNASRYLNNKSIIKGYVQLFIISIYRNKIKWLLKNISIFQLLTFFKF